MALTLEVLPRVVHLLRQSMDADGGEPLTLTKYRLLQRLVHRVCLTSDLAAELDVTVASVSAAVEHLVRRGLVERLPPTGDRREVPLTATAEGRRAVAAAAQRQRQALELLLGDLRGTERDALAVAVSALHRALAARRRP
jgi:DNA-binding MarR family transcriptional regulator